MVDIFWQIVGHDSYIIASILSFSIFLFFLNRLLQIRKTTREILPFIGITVLFFAAGISFFFEGWRLILNLFITDPFLNLLFHKIQFLAILGAIGVFIFLSEYVGRKSRYLLSYYVIGEFVIGLFFINDTDTLSLYSTIASLPVFLIALLAWYFVFVKPTSGFLRQRMIITFVGILTAGIGLTVRSRFITRTVGDYMTAVANSIVIIGISLIGFGFTAFSTLSDIQWKKKLRDLFIISEKGICLYAYSLEKNQVLKDADLVAMGFSGIQMLLSEMVKTDESLQLIDYQNIKIMVKTSTNTTFILVIKEESKFLQYKLKVFSDEFNLFFKDILKDWPGDMAVFALTSTLIQRVFELNK